MEFQVISHCDNSVEMYIVQYAFSDFSTSLILLSISNFISLFDQ